MDNSVNNNSVTTSKSIPESSENQSYESINDIEFDDAGILSKVEVNPDFDNDDFSSSDDDDEFNLVAQKIKNSRRKSMSIDELSEEYNRKSSNSRASIKINSPKPEILMENSLSNSNFFRESIGTDTSDDQSPALFSPFDSDLNNEDRDDEEEEMRMFQLSRTLRKFDAQNGNSEIPDSDEDEIEVRGAAEPYRRPENITSPNGLGKSEMRNFFFL